MSGKLGELVTSIHPREADNIFPFSPWPANPSSLLSTIQYVTSFYERRLSGEEEYWWAQFTGAVMFIKMNFWRIRGDG